MVWVILFIPRNREFSIARQIYEKLISIVTILVRYLASNFRDRFCTILRCGTDCNMSLRSPLGEMNDVLVKCACY